jgi:hypothetical protein
MSAEIGWGVSADRLGNVYLAGGTHERPGGGEGYDAFVSMFNTTGNLLWTSYFGSSLQDQAFGVSADGLGNVYMAGEDGGGELADDGGWDAFVTKHDSAGNLLWSRRLETVDDERARDVFADRLGNVYIAGSTEGDLEGANAGAYDAFLSKYDESGNVLWTRQNGSSQDDGFHAVSADGLGNVYAAGGTRGDLAGPNAGNDDAFLSKYDDAGNLLWTRQFGTATDDRAREVAADGLGNVYLAGFTSGSLDGPNVGRYDVFVSKFDPIGSLLWTRQLGTSFDDGCCPGGSLGNGNQLGVAVDGLGGVYLASFTKGTLSGFNPPSSYEDAFVAKYDAAGNLKWVEQFGAPGARELASDVSADGLGNIYVSGSIECFSFNPRAMCTLEGNHAFVAKFRDESVVPLPADFNADGTVDAADYVVWRNGLGTAYTQADYDAWRTNFGHSAVGAAAGAEHRGSNGNPVPIPEPNALFLMTMAIASVARFHRGKRKPQQSRKQ